MAKFSIGELTVEILGYQFGSASKYHDANWLVVEVGYAENAVSARFRKPCLMTSDLLRFRDGLSEVYSGTGKAADLVSNDPNLVVELRKVGSLGALKADVELRPETNVQSISLTIKLDQSYLPKMVAELDAILAQFPVRIAP